MNNRNLRLITHGNIKKGLEIIHGKDGGVPSELTGAFNIIFYSSVEDAVFKALSVE